MGNRFIYMQENFGFQTVNTGQKKKLVKDMFSEVSSKYDIMNDLMSAGLHRVWKNTLSRMVNNLNSQILDMAAGTGDITMLLKKRAIKYKKIPNITICDINQNMLDICEDKLIDNNLFNNVSYVSADAEKLPFDDNSFDYYIISFGIRNVSSVDQCLSEAYRVLRPGGRFLCLEFSKIEQDLLKKFYQFYSFNIIPMIGKHFAKAEYAYKYLVESIKLFYDQEDFKTMIQRSGFSNVTYRNLTLGVSAIHSGYKLKI